MTTPKKSAEEWLKSGGYLPRFMRDFHAQKDIFKWIARPVQNTKAHAKAEGRMDQLPGFSWVESHIYVVDFFLWYMAKHGYTLQPMRQDYEHASWDESIAAMRAEEGEALAAMFRQADAEHAAKGDQ